MYAGVYKITASKLSQNGQTSTVKPSHQDKCPGSSKDYFFSAP
jgi:hypothetical protein